MLTDSFGRKHDYLRLSITDRCNLRCSYCMPEDQTFSPRSELMSTEEIVQFAQLFQKLGVRKIRLTGGEPLMHPDFENIYRQLHELGIDLYITSNGLLIDQYLTLFQNYPIKGINISLDSLKPNQFKVITKRDFLAKTLVNIQKAADANLPVKINAVIAKNLNENEILDFVSLATKTNIEVRFIEFMPFNGNQWEKDLLVNKSTILKHIQTQYTLQQIPTETNSTSAVYSIHGHIGKIGTISSVTEPFCDGCNRLRLTADGQLKNCLFSNEEIDLLTPFRQDQDIVPLVKKHLDAKHFSRGGKPDFSSAQANEVYGDNRSMIKIGG